MKVRKWRHRISISVLTSTGWPNGNWDLPVLADDRAKPKICVGVRGRTLFCAVACTASEIQSSDVLLNGLLQKDFMRHSSIQTTLNTYGEDDGLDTRSPWDCGPTSDAALMDVSVRQRIVKKLAERVGFPVMVWMSSLGVVSKTSTLPFFSAGCCSPHCQQNCSGKFLRRGINLGRFRFKHFTIWLRPFPLRSCNTRQGLSCPQCPCESLWRLPDPFLYDLWSSVAKIARKCSGMPR